MSSFGQKEDIQIDDIWGFSLLHIYRLGFGYGHILTSVSAFTDEADIENFSKSKKQTSKLQYLQVVTSMSAFILSMSALNV